MRARLAQRAPSIGSFHSHWAQSVLGPGLVLDAMRRLHRGDHGQARETGDVVGMDDLGVLDPWPRVAHPGLLTLHGLDEVQRLAVPGVPDRVDRNLEAGLHEIRDQRSVEAVLSAADAAMSRTVGVVLEEPRPAGAERAIVEGLDRADDETPLVPRLRPSPQPPHA